MDRDKKSTERFAGVLVLAALALGAFGAGCEETGRYQLLWRFEEAEIDSYGVCSARGVEKLRVEVYKSGTDEIRARHEIPCFPPSRRSPRMPTGVYDLRIEAVRYDGEVFRNPDTNEQLLLSWVDGVKIRQGKWSPVEVTFTRAPRCLDGVDNDRDGRVDAGDPGCWELDGDGEPVLDEEGNPVYSPFDDEEAQTDDASPTTNP